VVWAVGVAVFALASLAALGAFIAKQPYGFDLWAYVLAGRHLLAGEPLYPPVPSIPFGPFGEYHYAPSTAVPFVLLAPLPFWLATAVWIGLNTGVAAAVGVHFIRPLPRDARPWAAAAFVLFLPLILEIELGNLNLLTVALCLVAWSQRQRPVVAGTLLAIAIGLKLLPLTLVLFYLAAGRWRIVLWTATVGAAGLLLTAAALPRDLGQYLALLFALGGSDYAVSAIAATPPAELAAVLASPVMRALAPLVAVASAIVGGRVARVAPRDETHLHHIALAFAPHLASFGPLWFPYLVTALPLLASSLRRALATPLPARVPLVAMLALAWLLMETFGRDDLVPVAAHLVGLAMLGAVAVVVVVRDGQPDRSPAFAHR